MSIWGWVFFTGWTKKKVADSTVDLNAPFLAGPYINQTTMPGTSAGAARNPWIRHMKASYQRPVTSTLDISSLAMVDSFLGNLTALRSGQSSDAQSRNVAPCNVSSGYGGAPPGFQATK